MRDEVDSGLEGVLKDDRPKSGYVEALAGYAQPSGLFGRLEAGYKLTPSAALFGYGEMDSNGGPQAGVGYKWTF